MEKHRNKFFTIFIIAGTFLTAGLAIWGSLKIKNEVPTTTNFALEANTENPVRDEKVDILSPDGKATLTVKNIREASGLVSQTFYISSDADKTPIKIFEKKSNPENLVTVPDNTFSPDNKRLFLKYEEGGTTRYIVMRTDGKDIKEGSQTVEIESLFSEKHPDYVITDVTGWGSYSLIVVNTDTKDGKIGPSWWFDLSNFSFIRLSSRFN